MRKALGGHQELPDDLVTKATVISRRGREVFSVLSRQKTDNNGTQWRNEEAQESNQRKRLARGKKG